MGSMRINKYRMSSPAIITTGLKTGKVEQFEGVVIGCDIDTVEVATGLFKLFGIVLWVNTKTYKLRDGDTKIEFTEWKP